MRFVVACVRGCGRRGDGRLTEDTLVSGGYDPTDNQRIAVGRFVSGPMILIVYESPIVARMTHALGSTHATLYFMCATATA